MIEPTQILLFTIIAILTIILLFIGWQIYQILEEIRKMLTKFNLMIDDARNFTDTIGKSVHSLNGFTEGVRAVLKVLTTFKRDKTKDGNRSK
ncbi:hypothetical protein HYW55_04770 [Candidatus Gottesmanbacteria bacterium]|nr:hypothetical protein [Candidatus Gottesmanbacteria bacterium]